MVFSSLTFLFYFLPLVVCGYSLATLVGKKPWLKNCVLLLASLVFYAWGEGIYIIVLVISILCNYVAGLLLESKAPASRKIWLTLAVIINLALLGSFKYAQFLAENINIIFQWLALPTLSESPVHLPIGISFFTFQAISYLVDVYRGAGTPQKNPLNLALYISLFPQLIAGPIVRYQHIAAELTERRVTLESFSSGAQRFTIGLAKKVLIANILAETADDIFSLTPHELSPFVCWLGLLCYSFQIYFDFSGYSDMAIGLGRMFGFHFLENFNYPYIARTMRDFWRRWHISLSTWFRDYLYIPLGGNRASALRTGFNLLIVFFLCGLWHGASWNFIVWGLLHGALLSIERIPRIADGLDRLGRPFGHLYVLFFTMIAWVFFRSPTMPHAWNYLSVLFGAEGDAPVSLLNFIDAELLTVLLFAAIGSTPFVAKCCARFYATSSGTARAPLVLTSELLRVSALTALFLLSSVYLAAGTYNPFIYFRF